MEKHPAKVFAETNAGKRGKIDGRELTIVGWMSGGNVVKILVLFDHSPHRSFPYKSDEYFWIYRNDVDRFICSYDMSGITIDLELPDDCLECGAKGNNPCIDNCPNK